jgi:hypothetical protein
MRVVRYCCVVVGCQSTAIPVYNSSQNPTQTAVGQSSTITIYNVTRTSDGIFLEIPLSSGGFLHQMLDLSESGNPYTVDVYEDIPPFEVLPIGPESRYAQQVDSAMLIPPSVSYPSFRFIESLTDSSAYCFEGTIGVANMLPGRSTAVSASVALIPNNGRSPQTPVSNFTSQQDEYLISSVHNHDVIPSELYDAIILEFQRLAIVTLDDENIALLPSLEYTIYQSPGSSDVGARIILNPHDYMGLVEGQLYPFLFPSSHGRRSEIGLNTLMHVGVFLDYRNRQIGFCEPI